MVKPLTFKGDKKPKKRKRPTTTTASDDDNKPPKPQASQASQPPPPPATTPPSTESTQTWTSADLPSDIAGPVLLAFATPLPYCLACDANGKVFLSAIENIHTEDGSSADAQMATAEPHDVRQVWVASRVEGMAGWGFRGHHGRYLSSDASGALSAHAEAMSPAETFQIAPHASGAPGGFAVQTARDTYLSFSPANDPISPASPSLPPSPHARPADPPPHALYIRMQTAHKARLATSLAAKAREKISRRELEDMVGRRLEEEEVRRLKRARREGGFYEAVLDVRVKGKHDKFAC